jgi:hypothetical protein
MSKSPNKQTNCSAVPSGWITAAVRRLCCRAGAGAMARVRTCVRVHFPGGDRQVELPVRPAAVRCRRARRQSVSHARQSYTDGRLCVDPSARAVRGCRLVPWDCAACAGKTRRSSILSSTTRASRGSAGLLALGPFVGMLCALRREVDVAEVCVGVLLGFVCA